MIYKLNFGISVCLTVTGGISATLWIESSEVRDSGLRGTQSVHLTLNTISFRVRETVSS